MKRSSIFPILFFLGIPLSGAAESHFDSLSELPADLQNNLQKIECTTHTGSYLEIQSQGIHLLTMTQVSHQIQIQFLRMNSIGEGALTQIQVRLKDQRDFVLIIPQSLDGAKAYFRRLNGEHSPTFSCKIRSND